jgi:benzoate-CoA ligase
VNAADETIGQALARGHGDVPAVLCGDRTLSYRELDALACRFGNGFRAAGIGVGDRVVLVLPDTPELMAAYLGAFKVGAVPIAFSTRASAADLSYVIEDSDCRLLMIEPDGASDLTVLCQVVTDAVAFAADQPAELETAPMSPEDPAFWFYTSGTTGRPKGVVHLQRAVLSTQLHLEKNLSIGPGDRIFATSKMFFAYPLGHYLGALRLGATIILHPDWPNAEGIAAVVDQFRPDLFLCVPTLYRNLLQGGFTGGGFQSVRHFVSAGEKLPASLFDSWRDATGMPILEGIGTSETAVLFIANTPDNVCPGSTGRPPPWVEVRLVDNDGAQVTAPDTLGNLQLRVGSMFGEYWGRPEQTEAAFRDGWNQTGDMFTFDADGWWYHQGRADDMIKISGQWVSPSEIEDCARASAAVEDAVAVGMADDDGLSRMVLFVVPARGGASETEVAEQATASLQAGLPRYKCPREVVVIDAIPRTATGKVQRFKLRDQRG